jgi:hypothetical protein
VHRGAHLKALEQATVSLKWLEPATTLNLDQFLDLI